MSPELIYIPVSQASQVEDGPALAHRTWVVHPLKGLAFRLEWSAGAARLVPLCTTHPLGAERLAREAGRGHDTQFVQAVFLRQAEALLAREGQATRRAASVPAAPPAQRTQLHAIRLARLRDLAA